MPGFKRRKLKCLLAAPPCKYGERGKAGDPASSWQSNSICALWQNRLFLLPGTIQAYEVHRLHAVYILSELVGDSHKENRQCGRPISSIPYLQKRQPREPNSLALPQDITLRFHLMPPVNRIHQCWCRKRLGRSSSTSCSVIPGFSSFSQTPGPVGLSQSLRHKAFQTQTGYVSPCNGRLLATPLCF